MFSIDVRSSLVEALELDLVGPLAGHLYALDRLEGWCRPSSWYLTGFLIPSGTAPEESVDADEDDDFTEVPEVAGLAEESNEERKAAKKGFFPSSMGLSRRVRSALGLDETGRRALAAGRHDLRLSSCDPSLFEGDGRLSEEREQSGIVGNARTARLATHNQGGAG